MVNHLTELQHEAIGITCGTPYTGRRAVAASTTVTARSFENDR